MKLPLVATSLLIPVLIGCGAVKSLPSGKEAVRPTTVSVSSSDERGREQKSSPAPAAAAVPAESHAGEARSSPAPAPPQAEKPVWPERLDIALVGAEKLTLVEYRMKGEKPGGGTVQLDGAVGISITNPSSVPVRLVHMDPANLVFTRVDSGEHFSLLHPCDPGLLLGSEIDPEAVSHQAEARVLSNIIFTLAPGQTRVFQMGPEWACSGGPWEPVPRPGEYTIEYRIHRLEPGWKPAADLGRERPIPERLQAARRAVAGDSFWQGAYRSAPARVVFKKPRIKKVD